MQEGKTQAELKLSHNKTLLRPFVTSGIVEKMEVLDSTKSLILHVPLSIAVGDHFYPLMVVNIETITDQKKKGKYITPSGAYINVHLEETEEGHKYSLD